MNKFSRILILAGSVMCFPGLATAQTQDSAFNAKAAIPVPDEGKTYPSYFLTMDQLKNCISVEENMAMLSGYIGKRNAIFETYREELAALDMEIKRIETYFRENPNTKIDDKENFETRNEMVRKNNDYVAQYNKKLEDYTTLQNAYDNDVSEFNSLSADFQNSCNGKRYYLDDLQAIRGN
ncbi:hypothetical protein [Sneathiella sp.]|jgi:hypothetical protein|uniref:hypothetical protein n=1 Tax=Sneathiella sp. TaxID=1964365 RepID=UPI0039E63CA6